MSENVSHNQRGPGLEPEAGSERAGRSEPLDILETPETPETLEP